MYLITTMMNSEVNVDIFETLEPAMAKFWQMVVLNMSGIDSYYYCEDNKPDFTVNQLPICYKVRDDNYNDGFIKIEEKDFYDAENW